MTKKMIFIVSVAIAIAVGVGLLTSASAPEESMAPLAADCSLGYELTLSAREAAAEASGEVSGRLRLSLLSRDARGPVWRWEWKGFTAFSRERNERAEILTAEEASTPELLEAVWIAERAKLMSQAGAVALTSRDPRVVFTTQAATSFVRDASAIAQCEATPGEKALSDLRAGVTRLAQLQRSYLLSQSVKAQTVSLSSEDRKGLIDSLLHADEPQAVNTAIARATLALRSYPQLTEVFLDTALDRVARLEGIDPKVIQIVGVIGGAHTKESEEALGRFIDRLSQGGSGQGVEYLEAAVRTLHLPHTPSKKMVRRVERLSKSEGQNLSTRQTALLALGTMVGRLGENADEERLFNELSMGAKAPNELAAAYLSALANTGDHRARKILEEASRNHPLRLVRKHAENELTSFRSNAI